MSEVRANTILRIRQLVARHLAELEDVIDEACRGGIDGELILPLKGARMMYRRWLAIDSRQRTR